MSFSKHLTNFPCRHAGRLLFAYFSINFELFTHCKIAGFDLNSIYGSADGNGVKLFTDKNASGLKFRIVKLILRKSLRIKTISWPYNFSEDRMNPSMW